MSKLVSYDSRILSTIYILYCVFLYFLYTQLGFIYVNEGAKYVDLANSLNSNTLKEYWAIYKLYFGYIIYLKLCLQIFSNKAILIFIHILLNFIGGYLILQIVRKHNWPRFVGYISLVFFLFCYPLQYWTLTLYTETSFVFLTLLLYYLGISLNLKTFLFFILVSILIIFWRPQGLHFVLLLIAFLSFLHNLISENSLFKTSMTIILILAFIMLFVKVDSLFYFAQFFNYEPFVKTKPFLHSDMLVKDNLFHAYQILIKEIGWIGAIELQLNKIYWFFNMTRPSYSFRSNLLLFSNSIVYFGLGFFGLLRLILLKGNRGFHVFTFFWFLSCLVNVFISMNDWHNRYNIIFIPFLCLSMGAFFHSLFAKAENLKDIQPISN